MASATVLSSVDQRGVACITLNRPQRNNAYNREMLETALHGLKTLDADPSVRMVVLRGNGKHFQAGVDLDWAAELAAGTLEENIAASRLTTEVVQTLDTLSKPTLALVHGATVGGGTGIIAACDIVIATASASFSISEARWGLVANPIFPQLANAIGVRNLRRYALTCERFDTQRAREIGLVHEVCEDQQLSQAAEPMIEGLLRSGPDALKESKRAIFRSLGDQVNDDTIEELIKTHAAKRLSTEATEGIESFKQKREPAWYAKASNE